jgi:hypothetical protein
MTTTGKTIEVVQRNCAIGIRFWDVVTATSAIAGLDVQIFPHANPAARRAAYPNPSGIYVAHGISGLVKFECDSSDPADQIWLNAASSPKRAYRVEVRDPLDRFLPIGFDTDLPERGLCTWATGSFSPPQTIPLVNDSGSPPMLLIERVPLFSAPTRPVPEPLAVVYAQLKEMGSIRMAAWALLGVHIDSVQRGLGLADGSGRVTVMFPYPEPPRSPLASPPEARSDYHWTITLSAYCSAASPTPSEVPKIPDLARILEQLATPRTVIDSTSSPATPRRLLYRVPLTARTEGLPAAEASYLMLSAA